MATYDVPDPLPLAADFLVRLLGPVKGLTGEPITAGTCLCQIRNAAGTVVGFNTGEYAAEPLPGGFNVGFSPASFLTAGETYYVEFTLTSSDGVVGFWRVERTAAYED